MRSYRKNVLRLAWQSKSSIIGSVIIIAIGIFMMVSMLDTLQNLTGQVFNYYEEYELADVFVSVRSMPMADLPKLEKIKGVESAGGRLSADVRVLNEKQTEISTLHLMSYMPDAEVNRLEISSSALAEDSLYIGSRMSDYFGFEQGDSISLIISGHSLDFVYQGTVNGPEYIYSVSGEGAMVPDGSSYDIAAVSYARLSSLLGQPGAVNEIGIKLSPGYEYEDLRHELNEFFAPYGLLSVTKQYDQASVAMVRGEMEELIATGTAVPMLFMAITVYMLYMSLRKMIEHDQTLIGSMKAFGMRNSELVSAYLIEGLAIGVLGAVVGCLTARPLGLFMFDLYLDFFTLPVTEYKDFMNTRIAGFATAVITSSAAVLLGVKKILGITPAMAMKSRSPEKARQVKLPAFMTSGLSTFRKLALRSMVRNPLRGLLIVLAVAFPFSLSAVLLSFEATIDGLISTQFEQVQAYDLMLTIDGFEDPHALRHAGEQLEHVTDAEAVCSLPVEIKKGSQSKFAVLSGLNKDSVQWHIVDERSGQKSPPSGGIILNARTAADLNAKAGDIVELSFPTLGISKARLQVTDVVVEIFGGGCYVDLSAFPSLFGISPIANTLLLRASDGHMEELKASVRETAKVTSIVDAKKIVDSYEDMFGSMTIMIDAFAIVSVIAGFLLIYNISMINIRERFTELGTLEVIGARKKELDRMLLDEKIIYYVLGVLLGIPGSFGIKKLFDLLMVSDSYTMTMTVPFISYVWTTLLCALMVAAAWRQETKLIRKIALTDILKERE